MSSQSQITPISPRTKDQDAMSTSSASGGESTKVQVDDGSMEEEGIDDEEETMNEGVAPKVARQPGQPIAQQRREHEVCHVPYRDWCKHCVRGRGRRRPHCRIGSGRDEDLPHAALDYTFFTQSGAKRAAELTEEEKNDETKAKTVLVMKDSLVEAVFAYVVGKKGAANEEWLAVQMLDDLDSLGLNRARIIVKSDQENAIEDVKKDMSRRRIADGQSTTQESSPTGDSNANGRVEKGIQEVNGVTRTLRSALEERLGCTITINHPIFPWLVRHAAQVIIRYQVRSSGKTSYRMGKGVDSILPVAEFGEVVHFAPLKTFDQKQASNFDYRYDEGIWLGNIIRAGENLVFVNDGVYRVDNIRRKDTSESWSKDMVNNIAGTPSEPVPDSGEHKLKAYVQHKHGNTGAPAEMPTFVPQEDVPRRTRKMQILKTDIREHGASDGCAGCRAALADKRGTEHSEACRTRLEELIGATDAGKDRIDRAMERMTKAIVEEGERLLKIVAESAPRVEAAAAAAPAPTQT